MDRPRQRIVALLPMRAGSERVTRKNLRPLAGRPLYHHVMGTLLETAAIDAVVVDTDDPEVAGDVARCFPGVRLIERPPALRGGMVSMNRVIAHDVAQIAADLYLQTHATNPLLESATIDRAIERFVGARARHDSLMSVTRVHKRFWTAAGAPLNHDPARLLRTQDLEPLYEENSCLYLFPGTLLEGGGGRVGARPLLFEIDPIEAWDIDEEADLAVAEALLAARTAT